MGAFGQHLDLFKRADAARTKWLFASGAHTRSRAGGKKSILTGAQQTRREGAGGWCGQSRAGCGGDPHAYGVGRRRREPQVSNRPRMLRGKERFSRKVQESLLRLLSQLFHAGKLIFEDGSVAEFWGFKLERLALKAKSLRFVILFVQVKLRLTDSCCFKI